MQEIDSPAGTQQLREVKPGSQELMLIVQRRYLEAMRDALVSERGVGAYSSETYRQAEAFLDGLEQRLGRT